MTSNVLAIPVVTVQNPEAKYVPIFVVVTVAMLVVKLVDIRRSLRCYICRLVSC